MKATATASLNLHFLVADAEAVAPDAETSAKHSAKYNALVAPPVALYGPCHPPYFGLC